MMKTTQNAVPGRRFFSCLELRFVCLPFRPNCVFTIYEHFYSEQFYGTIDAGVDYLMYNEKIPIYGIERMRWMSKEPIMIIHVEIDRSNCPEMTMPDGKVKIIPFTGTVEGSLFHGRIMPGAADVQVTNPAGVRHMCAQYMPEGLDNTGAACHIFTVLPQSAGSCIKESQDSISGILAKRFLFILPAGEIAPECLTRYTCCRLPETSGRFHRAYCCQYLRRKWTDVPPRPYRWYTGYGRWPRFLPCSRASG